jgi:hypothetical protein
MYVKYLDRMRGVCQLIQIIRDYSIDEQSREIEWIFRIAPTKHNLEYRTHLSGLQTKVLTSFPQQTQCRSSGQTMDTQSLPMW